MDSPHGLVAEAEAIHGPGLEVLGHHVELGCQLQEQLAPALALQVDADAAFAQVVAEEGGADWPAARVEHRRLRAAPGLARRRLDLDHVGAETSELLGGVRQGLHLLGSQHPDALEGSHRSSAASSKAATIPARRSAAAARSRGSRMIARKSVTPASTRGGTCS